LRDVQVRGRAERHREALRLGHGERPHGGHNVQPAAWVAIGKAADIAGFTLLSWRGVNSSDSTYAIVKDRHDAARKWLADLITGDVELPGVDPERGGPLVKSGRGPRWTRDALLGGDVTPYYPPGIDLGDGES
jgi:hypothetical protein